MSGRLPDRAQSCALTCEKRSIADIVERALEAYEAREAGREPASSFYARLSAKYGTDIDLETIIREGRRVDSGPDL